MKDLESRLTNLETGSAPPLFMSDAVNAGPNSHIQLSMEEHKVALADAMFIRVKDFRSQFYGPTKAAALIANMPELQVLMHSLFKQNDSQSQFDFRNLKRRLKYARKLYAAPSGDNLLSFLPRKSHVDDYIETYLSTFETTYRLLHVPSFRREYSEFWKNPTDHRQGFIAILLLMIASVRPDCSRPPRTFYFSNSSNREKSMNAIDASEAWLERQSQKHLTLTYFQVSCLLFISKAVNQAKEKREWQAAGSLLQFLLASGFHRDPKNIDSKRYALTTNLNKDVPKPIVGMLAFEQEMRRRIWATAVELELQASIERGMASISNGFAFDTVAPLNVNDDEIGEDMRETPDSEDRDHFTSTSYQHISYETIRLRIALNAHLNDPRTCLSYTDVLKYEHEIQGHLNNLPTFSEPGSTTTTSQKALMAHSLLDFQLRHFLILIHTPFIYSPRNPNHTRYSSQAVILAATHIINSYQTLSAQNIHSLSTMRNDTFRAPLTLAYAALAPNISGPSPDIFAAAMLDPISRAIAQAFDLLSENVMRLGSGARELWVISAANALVRCKARPDNSEAEKRIALDALMAVLKAMLDGQEVVGTDAAVMPAPAPMPPPDTRPVSVDVGANMQLQQQNLSQQAWDMPLTSTAGFGMDAGMGLDAADWAYGNFWDFMDGGQDW